MLTPAVPGLLFWIIAAALAMTTLLAYARVASAEFTYLDDRVYVTENEMVQKGLTWSGVAWALTTFHASNWHPLTWLSHMADWTLFGADAGGHHLTSVVLHVTNVVLLFYAFWRMTGALWPSAFVAGCFGLHPAHVESVAWVAERKDVLSTLLGLGTLIAYVRFTSRRTLKTYLVVLILYGASLMAKPMMVTLPFVLLLLDYWPLRRPSTTGEHTESLSWWRLVAEKVPLFALAAASSIITMIAQHAGGAMVSQAMLPFEIRVGNALISYVKYLGMAFWPVGLAVYYPHPLKPYPLIEVLGAAALLLVGTGVCLALRRRHPYVPVGWLWFLGTLVPVIGLIQVGGQAMADRYTYFPYVGLSMAVAWAVRSFGSRMRVRLQGAEPQAGHEFTRPVTPLRVVGMLALTALAMGVWIQTGYWQTGTALFQRALDVVPNNAQAHIFMANTLVRQGKTEEAAYHFGEAVRLVPNEPLNLTDYGHALLEDEKWDQAAEQLEKALALLPSFADAHFFLGRARLGQGQWNAAVGHFQKALELNPKLLKAHLYIGSAKAEQGQWAAAISHLQTWLQADPNSIEAMTKLAQCYYSLGSTVAAQDVLQKAMETDPRNPYPPAVAGQMAAWSGDIDKAIALYERSLAIDPNYAETANNLALIRAIHPDPKYRNAQQAVQLAERANRLRQARDPVTLDTLAAAYAESGRFPEAIQAIDQAIEIAAGEKQPELARHLRQRRELYVQGRPARAE